jgi:23S rRNA A2030 N6-methylase RlmJ
MPTAGFEPAILLSEPLQAHAANWGRLLKKANRKSLRVKVVCDPPFEKHWDTQILVTLSAYKC